MSGNLSDTQGEKALVKEKVIANNLRESLKFEILTEEWNQKKQELKYYCCIGLESSSEARNAYFSKTLT